MLRAGGAHSEGTHDILPDRHELPVGVVAVDLVLPEERLELRPFREETFEDGWQGRKHIETAAPMSLLRVHFVRSAAQFAMHLRHLPHVVVHLVIGGGFLDVRG